MRQLVILVVLLIATTARADDHLFAGDGLYRPPIEWSTWIRGGYGRAHVLPDIAERSIGPVIESEHHWELAAGIEGSLALSRHGDVRLGAWIEQRGLDREDTFGGGELVLTRVPTRVDMFLYEGHGILMVRAGRNAIADTAAIAYGYVAPFWLEGECRERFYGIDTGVCHPRPDRTTRMMAGLRAVATFTRDRDDARLWSATVGIEFEPAGALRMLLVARSWYAN